MIGVDMLRVGRVERAAKNERFLSRVFTEAELGYYRAKGERAETLAGLYCAKEAALKALGTGIGKAALRDVEITHDEDGRPIAVLHGEAARLAGGATAHISISHDGDYAIAVCIMEAK